MVRASGVPAARPPCAGCPAQPTVYRPHRCRYEQWLRAGKPGLPRPAYVTAIRIFKEELLSKRVVEKAAQLVARANPYPNANATPNTLTLTLTLTLTKAAQLVADLDLTCPTKLFTASTLLSALARPGRESAELARRVQQLVDMAGEVSIRVKESDYDLEGCHPGQLL